MKLGILTYHYIPNIGATLQAYALWEKLNKMGCDCEIIDYRCENITKREIEYKPHPNKLKNYIIKYLFWPKTVKRIKECQSFINKQTKLSDIQYNRKNITGANNIYDIFISGSDMLWNLDVNGYDYTYMLDFVKGAKKVSYATSIGDEWKNKDVLNVKKLLKNYEMLSTREEDTKEFIENSLNFNCKWVCDPTMLLEKTEWEKFAHTVAEKKYILVYFPTKLLIEKAKKYAKKYDKTVLVVNPGVKWKGTKTLNVYSPESWISYFINADAIFTNSYHGLLFALYFEKKVWTDNKSNRVYSLLKRIDGLNIYLDRDKELKNKLDYEKITKEIKKFREESIDYIKNMLV